jgi:hypothetical protein
MSTPLNSETLPPHDNNEEKKAEHIQPLLEDKEKAVDTTAPSSQPSTSSAPAQEHPDDERPASPASVLASQNPQRYAQGLSDIPPPLPYSCWNHKLSIGIFWFFILAETCFVPISLYYGLWFGTTVRHGARMSFLFPSITISLKYFFTSLRDNNLCLRLRLWLRVRLPGLPPPPAP